jgi:hypothetical protein
MRHRLSSFSFDVPEDWGDITPEDDETHPFTMALDDGVGVIQVSLAEWKGGPRPGIDGRQLTEMFAKYCVSQGLEVKSEAFEGESPLGVGGLYRSSEELFAAWYVSDGQNVALVTYVSQLPNDPASEKELTIARRLVRSANFGG